MDNRENGLDTFLLAIGKNFTSLTRVLPGPSAALAADSKYKKYTQQVDKCLATFDSAHEWADFIAFLTKLLKVRLWSSRFLRHNSTLTWLSTHSTDPSRLYAV